MKKIKFENMDNTWVAQEIKVINKYGELHEGILYYLEQHPDNALICRCRFPKTLKELKDFMFIYFEDVAFEKVEENIYKIEIL